MNPYKDSEKMEARILEVQRDNAAGPIASPEPISTDRTKPIHRTMLRGVAVHLPFDQQPPQGSIPVPGPHNKKWTGNLIFLAPDGTIWTVPDIWYNQTWQNRIDWLKGQQELCKERAKRCDENARSLQADHKHKYGKLSTAIDQEIRELRRKEREQEKMAERLNFQEKHIQKYAALDSCPCLAPLDPPIPYENE